MKQMGGVSKRNAVREDVNTVRRLYEVRAKSIDEILGDILGVFENMFQNMRENSFLAESFSYVMGFSRQVIEESDGKADAQSYEKEVKKLARQYGINYFKLMSQAQMQTPQSPGELEEAVDSEERESVGKTMERGRIRKKPGTETNKTKRAEKLFDMLRKKYMATGEESNKFQEIYKSYCAGVQLLKLEGQDVSEYPTKIEELRERFRQKPDFENALIDYTRPNAQANLGALI